MNDQLQYDTPGIDLTKQAEGCSLTSYQDSKGVWTIGIGHTGAEVHAQMTITPAQAQTYLLQDIQAAENAVKREVTVPLTQDQFDALVDFTFNVGQGNLASSTLLKLVNQKQFAAADEEFSKWVRCGGQVLLGLTRRREAEAKLFAEQPPISIA